MNALLICSYYIITLLVSIVYFTPWVVLLRLGSLFWTAISVSSSNGAAPHPIYLTELKSNLSTIGLLAKKTIMGGDVLMLDIWKYRLQYHLCYALYLLYI